jgi:hypothetical protein
MMTNTHILSPSGSFLDFFALVSILSGRKTSDCRYATHSPFTLLVCPYEEKGEGKEEKKRKFIKDANLCPASHPFEKKKQ